MFGIRIFLVALVCAGSIVIVRPGEWRVAPAFAAHESPHATFTALYAQTREQVLAVRTERMIKTSDAKEETRRSFGSGVVLSSQKMPSGEFENFAVTNFHVIENAVRVTVKTLRGTRHEASIVGFSPLRDLAAMRFVTGVELKPARFGDSDALIIGQEAYVVGHPFGAEWTFSAARIGNLKQDPVFDDVQVDGVVNPGNSGGALFSMKGELIGIPVMSASASRIGIAISSNMVARMWPRLLAGGEVLHSVIGVRVVDAEALVESDARSFGITYPLLRESGVLVVSVTPDSPAAKAGIRPNSYILSINGKEIPTVKHMRDTLGWVLPGEPVSVFALQNGKNKKYLIQTAPESRLYQPEHMGSGILK